jgi:hypothetical protein
MASEGKKRKLDVDDDTKNAHYTPVMPDRDNFNRTEYYSPTWESSHWERFQPKEAINGSKVIEFELRSLFKNQFYDMSSIELGTTIKLTDAQGRAIEEGHVLTPINYFAQTMIQNVCVYLNDEQVYNSGPYYAEKALLMAQTNHTWDDRRTSLYRQGYSDEDPVNQQPTYADKAILNRALFFGDRVPGAAPGDNPTVRFNLTPHPFYVPLLADVFTPQNVLLPYVKCRVVITLHSDPFVLWVEEAIAGENYKFVVEKAELMCVRLKSHDKYYDSLLKQMKDHGPIKYRFKRMEVKSLEIPSGTEVFEDCSFVKSATNPTRGYIGMRLASLARPNYTKNPLQFNARWPDARDEPDRPHRSEIANLEFSVGGNKLEYTGLASDFYSYAQWHYQKFCQRATLSGGGGVGFYLWSLAKYFIPFDLTTPMRAEKSGNVRLPVKEGDFKIAIKFTSPLLHAIQLLVFQEYNASYNINYNSVVTYKYLD